MAAAHLDARGARGVRLLFGRGIRDVNVPYRLIRNAACRGAYALFPSGVLVPYALLSGFARRAGVRLRQDPVEVRGRERREIIAGQARWVQLAVRGCAQLVGPASRWRRG